MRWRAKRLSIALLSISFVGGLIVACGHGSDGIFDVTQGTVIQNTTVVNTRDGTLNNGQAVVIDGGKITRIAPTANVRVSGSATAVDGTGKFLVPGFLDMHAHAMVHVDENPSYFPLMVANGITGFREMGAFPGQFPDMVSRAQQLNANSAAGRIDAPEVLLIPSDIFNGTNTAASAVQGVDQQKALGVDFIKVISANRDAMLAFLGESKRLGLPLAGHLTPAVSASESSQLGWKSIEHLGSGIGILLDCTTNEVAMRQTMVAAAGLSAPAYASDTATLQELLATYSNEKCLNLATTFVQNGTWNVPTLRRVKALETTDDPAFQTDPDLAYVDKIRLATWMQLERTFANLTPSNKAALRQTYALQQSVTKMLKQSGVKMLTVSDSGVASVWVVPGFGLHDEFHELATAGLSPLEILQMTTLNGAEFLNREESMGTVETGKNADLVLLEGNPIEDAANLDRISAVLLKGRYLDKAVLAKMKSDVATAYKASTTPVTAAAIKASLDAE
ncbi:amidohydrolase family protein [Burkholderia sp. PAMC 26561]|uniref:amidohydrolase family protein n=1 Tax=Burkholderia sp. PAMC 26561 TaxID=1795043 RepID=UPI00076B6B2A|nr:amidohydrolase family protein [Burkholderia sp. PAMC 26561]AME27135.1 hypothetical protein AXG89_24725 [Burkholderia sp. PAMC 26561]AME27716.1 hypothetical protein AXG89_27965 [Burkholderia sp. PAMC 26561]